MRIRAVLMLSAILSVTGCAVLPKGALWKSLSHRHETKNEEVSEADQRWRFVGTQGRGHRPMEQDRDPISNWLTTDKAKEIDRNLGIAH